MCVCFFVVFLFCSVVCDNPIIMLSYFLLLAVSYQNNECACSNLVEGERIVRKFCLFACKFFSIGLYSLWDYTGFGERKIYSSANGEKLQIVFLSNPNVQHFNRMCSCCCCCWVEKKNVCIIFLCSVYWVSSFEIVDVVAVVVCCLLLFSY